MADSVGSVPPGQFAPFATVTATDHSAWILISTALGLSMSLLFAAIRIFIRSATKHGFGKDDYALAAATVRQEASKQAMIVRPLTIYPGPGERTEHHTLELMRRRAWKVKCHP